MARCCAAWFLLPLPMQRRQANGPMMDFNGRGSGGGRGRHHQGWGGEPLMHGMQQHAAAAEEPGGYQVRRSSSSGGFGVLLW